MSRLLLNDLRVKQHGLNYVLTLVLNDAKAYLPTDGDTGHIATAFSACAKSIIQQVTGLPQTPTELTTSGIVLDQFRIDRLYVQPFKWQLVMEKGPHKFTCNLDRDLEHVLAGFSAALKFFAVKYGVALLYDEEIVNIDRAHEGGYENN